MYSLTAHPTSLQVPYPAHSTQSLKKKKKQKNFPLIAVPDHFGNKDQFQPMRNDDLGILKNNVIF